MIAPRHVRRLEAWLAAEGCRWERFRYARAEAGGEVAACRFAPRGAPRGRVVLAHGAGNDALFPLLSLAKPLVRRGFELFCFDLDGHGRESTTSLSPGAIDGAIAAAVREATADRPELPLHVVGHSLGGSLALHALSSGALDGVASAAIISSPIQVSLDFRVALGEVRGFLSLATLSQREHYGLWGMIPAFGRFRRGAYPLRIAAAADASEAGRERAAFDYVRTVQGMLARMDLEHAAERVTLPVLLVYGTGDRLVPHAQGERLARALPAAELVLVEGASHWSAVFADVAVTRVVEWVEGHTKRAA